MVTKCEHVDKLVYAKGMCQSCYYYKYNNQKKTAKKAQEKTRVITPKQDVLSSRYMADHPLMNNVTETEKPKPEEKKVGFRQFRSPSQFIMKK